MQYGLPYKGSKNAIAEDVVAIIPPAECLVDAFAGGCAITHAALLSGKFERIIANDIQAQYPRLFKQAAEGKLPPDFRRFISRDEFEQTKATNPIAAVCYSFGNNTDAYLYNPDTERAK